MMIKTVCPTRIRAQFLIDFDRFVNRDEEDGEERTASIEMEIGFSSAVDRHGTCFFSLFSFVPVASIR